MKLKSTKKGRVYQRDLASNPYINGVKGQNEEVVIRPLTEDEFNWLEKFNQEFVEGNFERDSESNITPNNLHFDLIQQTEDRTADLKAQIKEVAAKLSETNGYREMHDRKSYWKYKKNLYKEHVKLTEELEKVNITGNIHNDKYARRFDVMAYIGTAQRTERISDLFEGVNIDTNECKLFEYLESSKL